MKDERLTRGGEEFFNIGEKGGRGDGVSLQAIKDK